MSKYYRSLFVVLAVFGIYFSDFQGLDASESVRVELLSENASIQPESSFWVAFRFDLAPGWHLYWKNPGESGFPPSVDWELPEGFEVSELHFPLPKVFLGQGLQSYGYEQSVQLLAHVTAPRDITPGEELSIKATVDWLACEELCVPGGEDLRLTLPVESEARLSDGRTLQFFEDARALLPQPSEALELYVSGDHWVLTLKDPHANRLEFFPLEQDDIDGGVDPQLAQENGSLELRLGRQEKSGDYLSGVLAVYRDGHLQKVVDVRHSAQSSPAEDKPVGFLWALLLAFLGGLVLNVMPCVLPVITLKIMSFVNMAGEERGKVFLHGMSFALGVVLSFWVLAGLLLALQAYGHAVGWGFQLQEARFVGIMSIILFAMALSFWGVYELGVGLAAKASSVKTQGTGLANSFFSGMLATLVATPCTGPGLGTAIGYAVTLSPIQAFAIFTMVALGLAFPYILLSAFPALLRFVPKPGPWMESFKQFMGFLMMSVVIWLLWVFTGQQDANAALLLSLGLLSLAVAAWIYGRWVQMGGKALSKCFALAFVALGLYAGHVAAHMEPSKEAVSSTQLPPQELAEDAAIRQWQRYSDSYLDELRAEGKPVFVDFTAKWCLICQANKVALYADQVADRFAELGVVKLEADWTKYDPEITAALARHGRNGVPLYLLYHSEREKPWILPQNLTPGILMDYLNRLDD